MADNEQGVQTPETNATVGQNPAVSPTPSETDAQAPTAGSIADPMAEAASKTGEEAAPADPMAEATGKTEETAKETEKPTVPEKYEAFKVGEQTLPEEATAAFSEVAKKYGLTQEGAQEVVNSFMPAVQAQVLGYQKEWLDACRADKEIGGERFNENMAIAGAGYRTYADKDLQAVFKASGLSRHPAVVRHFYRLGKSLQQDNGVAGGASTSAPTRRLYPKSDMVPDTNQQ
jgi:hypothetical protein